MATRSYFIFSSPWSQINCLIDLKGRAAMALWLTTVTGKTRALQELMSASTAAAACWDKRRKAPSPGPGAAFRVSVALPAELPTSAPVWWTEVGPQVQKRKAGCLSRQAVLLGLTLPLMSFCKGIK